MRFIDRHVSHGQAVTAIGTTCKVPLGMRPAGRRASRTLRHYTLLPQDGTGLDESSGYRNKFRGEVATGAASCKGAHPSPLIVALPSPSPSNFTHTLTPAPGDTQGTRLSDKTCWIITMWLPSFFLFFCAARTTVIAAPAAIQECLDIDNQNPPPMWFGSPTVRIPPSLSPARLLLTTSAVENDRQPQPELSCPISAQCPRRMPR